MVTVLAQPTQRWAALLLTMKMWFTYSKKIYYSAELSTEVRRRLLLYAFKLILKNIQSELINKSAIISTQGWTNSLGTAHSKIGGPTFVNEKVVHTLKTKSNVVLNFETKVRWRQDYHYMHLN